MNPTSRAVARTTGQRTKLRLVTARTAAALAVMSGVLLSGCGHKAVQTRTAPIHQCIEQARSEQARFAGKTQGTSPILAWHRVAPIDRWIAEIDRIGKRAGIFAPKSSFRDHAMEMIRDAFTELGMQHADWIDTKRPWHVFMQSQAPFTIGGKDAKPEIRWIFGGTAILPTKGRDMFEPALPRGDQAAGPRPNSIFVGKKDKGAFIDGLNFFTEVVTLREDRYPKAYSAAMCLHTRAPERMFELGFAVADIYKAHGVAIGELIARSMEELPNTPNKKQTLKSLRGMGKWFGEYLVEMDTATVSGDIDEKEFTLGFAMRAIPGKRTADRLAKMAAAPVNPLVAQLPASAWYASGDTYAGSYDEKDFAAMLGFYTDALDMSEAASGRLIGFVKSMIDLLGDHGASAMYIDGRFPAAYVNIMQSKDPEKLVTLLADGVFTFLDIMENAMKESRAKLRGLKPDVDKKIDDALSKAREKTLAEWVTELEKVSAAWPVKFTFTDKKTGNMRCRTLTATADMKQLVGNRIAMRALGFTGRSLQAAICTTDKHVLTSFGPHALATAALVSAGTGQTLGKKAAYKTLMGRKMKPVVLVMLNPGPLLDMVTQIMPIPLSWPEGDAISLTCDAEKLSMQCDLNVPTSVIDLARQVREAFANFGRKRR